VPYPLVTGSNLELLCNKVAVILAQVQPDPTVLVVIGVTFVRKDAIELFSQEFEYQDRSLFLGFNTHARKDSPSLGFTVVLFPSVVFVMSLGVVAL
jgi:hypothetical protein